MAADEEVEETVTDWLHALAAVRLVQRLDKCLNRNGDYVEK
jgi:hypothetical protein